MMSLWVDSNCLVSVAAQRACDGVVVVNVPAGFSDAGLPFGLQLIGAKGQDVALLSIAQAWHEAKDWPNARPPQL